MLFKKRKPPQEFERFVKILEDDTYGMFPAPTNGNFAINLLVPYLLGDDYYIVDPVGVEQGNTIIVHDILLKHSRRYRKDIARYLKRKRRET